LSEEEEEEEEEGLGTSGLPSTLTKTQKIGNDSAGFLHDYPEERAFGDRSCLPVSATDSGGIDLEEVKKYVKLVKRRAQESNRVGGSSMDKSVILRRPQLWMLPVPVRSFYIDHRVTECFTARNGEYPRRELTRNFAENA
jgi:hypothetical protein